MQVSRAVLTFGRSRHALLLALLGLAPFGEAVLSTGIYTGGTRCPRRAAMGPLSGESGASPLRRAWGRAAARGTTVARHCSPATSV
jgi:hypothetical protein